MKNTPTATPFDLDQEALDSLDELLQSSNGAAKVHTGKMLRARFLSASGRELYFDIGEKEEGICPRDEFAAVPDVGEELDLIVLQREGDGPPILSRKEAEHRLVWQSLQESHKSASNLSAKILRIMPNGYLVDYQGLELFMPLSQSSFSPATARSHKLGKEIDFRVLELRERYHSAIISHRVVIAERNEILWDQFEQSHKVGDLVDGVVMKKVSFGIFLEVEGLIGLLHLNDISWKKGASFRKKFPLKSKMQLKILAMDRENNRINLGLKQLSEEPWEWGKRELSVGQKVKARVNSIANFGAFLEIHEGLEGLLHLNEMSWLRKKRHPKKYLSLGQEMEVEILSIDWEKKRLSLSLKKLLADPWENIEEKVKAGELYSGKVSGITDFGIFVNICEGIDGLIHNKDFSFLPASSEEKKNSFKRGQEIQFKVLSVDPKERRIACGIKQLEKNPHQQFEEQYSLGASLSCTVKAIAPFGIIVSLENGLEGLVSSRELGLGKEKEAEDVYKAGDTLEVVLTQVDVKKGRIYLSLRGQEKKKKNEIEKSYMQSSEKTAASTPFAELLSNYKIAKDS